ncbi:MAG: exported protein of unknown function [Deltaproteobacteria bacterium]|nr:exported protein of unknown function [Deltaproteobacteria bacterium]
MNAIRFRQASPRLALQIVAASLSIFLAWIALKPWMAEMTVSEPYTIDMVNRAIAVEPDNAHYHYLEALLYLSDAENINLEQAKKSILRAIMNNPSNAAYWRGLYLVESAMSNTPQAEKAIRRAVVLSPKDPETRWMLGNHYLLKGEKVEALREIRFIMETFSGETVRAFPILSIAANHDAGLILEEAIPDKIDIKREYLGYLMGRKDTAAAKLLWEDMAERYPLDKKERLRFVDYLIDEGAIEDAKKEWSDLTGTNSWEPVWNGGFEQETWSGGFDWRIDKTEGAAVSRIEGTSVEGKHSLNVRFDGSRNIDFYHLRQVVPLKPDTKYRFTMQIRAEDLTTNGIKMEFYGNSNCSFHTSTDTVSGNVPWTKYQLEIKTPAGCSSGTIRLRREKSTKFNNLIAGKVWIDEVRLDEGK